MSKQRIDEMKKFMQIAEGNVAEAKVDPKLKKAAKILMQVVDGLDREYEELMNGADGDPEELEFAEHVAEDAEDYKKIVNMLLSGRGKAAARLYDDLDTVSREFVYDHAYSDIEFLQKVFGDLGSNWLFLEYDDEYDDELDEGWFDDLGTGEEFARGAKDVCKKCGREGCECGPDCDCEPVNEVSGFEVIGSALILGFIGWALVKGKNKLEMLGRKRAALDVLKDFEDNFSDAAIESYAEKLKAKLKSKSPQTQKALMKRIENVVKFINQMPDEEKWYEVEWHVREILSKLDDVERFVRKSNTGFDRRKSAKRRAAKEGIHLDSIVESVLSEDSYADYIDWSDSDLGPAAQGKSQAAKDVADELGLDVEDAPKQKEFDMDDYPEAEDEELGLRFD